MWESTACTFIAKFVFALTFVIPVMLLELQTAIIASIVWSLIILTALNFYVARMEKTGSLKVVAEHLAITLIVIAATHYAGD